ncbi:hypothetical protein AAMO2058_000447100 [Amorphochlora amoebiformis]
MPDRKFQFRPRRRNISQEVTRSSSGVRGSQASSANISDEGKHDSREHRCSSTPHSNESPVKEDEHTRAESTSPLPPPIDDSIQRENSSSRNSLVPPPPPPDDQSSSEDESPTVRLYSYHLDGKHDDSRRKLFPGNVKEVNSHAPSGNTARLRALLKKGKPHAIIKTRQPENHTRGRHNKQPTPFKSSYSRSPSQSSASDADRPPARPAPVRASKRIGPRTAPAPPVKQVPAPDPFPATNRTAARAPERPPPTLNRRRSSMSPPRIPPRTKSGSMPPPPPPLPEDSAPGRHKQHSVGSTRKLERYHAPTSRTRLGDGSSDGENPSSIPPPPPEDKWRERKTRMSEGFPPPPPEGQRSSRRFSSPHAIPPPNPGYTPPGPRKLSIKITALKTRAQNDVDDADDSEFSLDELKSGSRTRRAAAIPFSIGEEAENFPPVPQKRKMTAFIPIALQKPVKDQKVSATSGDGQMARSAILQIYADPQLGLRSLCLSLVHKPKLVTDKVRSNIVTSQRIANSLKKMFLSERSHAGKINEIVAKERMGDLFQEKSTDSANSKTTWQTIVESFNEIAMKRTRFANFFISVIDPFLSKMERLKELVQRKEDAIMRRKATWKKVSDTILTKRMECTSEYQQLRGITILLTNAGASLEDVELLYTKNSRSDLYFGSQSRTSSNRINAKHVHLKVKKSQKAKAISNLTKKIEKQLQRCIECFQEYDELIQQGNESYRECWGSEHSIPVVVAQICDIECSRFLALNNFCTSFEMFVRDSHVPTWVKVTLEPLCKIHEELMLQDWIQERIKQHGQCKIPQMFENQLQCSIDDLMTKKWTEMYSQYKNPVFYCVENYIGRGTKECSVSVGDLVLIDTKSSEGAMLRCQVLTGPNKHFTGLLPRKILKRETVDSSMKLMHVLSIEAGFNAFEQHLKKEYSHENLAFWRAVQMYRTLSKKEYRKIRARNIMNKFIFETAVTQINIMARHRNEIEKKFSEGEFELDLFSKAQLEIYELMRKDSFARSPNEKPEKSLISSFLPGLHII